MNKPLDGLLVLDFTQFLSGPSSTLRLHDLGARVIKVEHYEKGDAARELYAPQHSINGRPAFFQATNRGKESISLNLKDKNDLALIKRIIKKSDIVVNNFRPGVMNRLGLDDSVIHSLKADIIYGEITGYGSQGPWAEKPGQDLLLQAVSGLLSLSGCDNDGPVPMGLAIVDYLAGAQLTQGLLAALLCDETNRVEVSMLEAIIDFQFEPFTLYLNDKEPVKRGDINAAHALVAAPYGLYRCENGYLALAMGAIPKLAELLSCKPLQAYTDSTRWFTERDEIKKILAEHLKTNKTEHWLSILEPADIWCAPVFNWLELIKHEGFSVINMLQEVGDVSNRYTTTRCPIRLDDNLLMSGIAAPTLGEHTDAIWAEFG